MISQSIFDNIQKHRTEFLSAQPFRHVVLDNFLARDKAEQMLLDFPCFEPKRALNEMGEVGGKAVYENIKEISLFYREFAAYIKSDQFLHTISELTGIEHLISDETNFGGGTHENLNGQELDPHVDFNYDERTWVHRRLNLLLYLNKEWEDDWGGSIELHSDPRHPEKDAIKVITPLFNRCLIFETNEHSWHGFSRIQLPPDRLNLSRKSFSLYLYTKERPSDEVAPSHSTFYVQRPLPAHIRAGHTLSAEDFETIRQLIHKRDRFIEFHQKRELQHGQMYRDLLRHLEIANDTLFQIRISRSWRLLAPLRGLKHLLYGLRQRSVDKPSQQ